MLNLKKTAVAVLALSSGAVFAGTMGPVCSAVNVTVPCESTAWDLGARALYFQPNVGGTSAGISKTISTGAGQSVDLGRNPKWGWGWMIEGSYHFNTGNDLNLNWWHVGTNRSGGFNGSATVAVDLLDPPVSAATTTVNRATAKVSPKWDAVNLEFGQHVDFGENKSIRFHGGFEFARLTADTTFRMSGSSTTAAGATPSFSIVSTNSPSYNGFGPRLGADAGYDWGNGLGIYAKGAMALLAGTSKFSTTSTNVLTTHSVTTNSSTNTVVPELEGKLGANYTYAMAQGDITLDVGWMWINYFNTIRSQSHQLLDAPDVGDFGLQGVYFGLKWLGNVA
ncbi:MAG: hypothetical protein A3E88_05135 [Legionellales bacterium RIFCSPHIGHO2_12_FULL_35_11]|nr:MAG: hypothetical protein A3E88_05135 [Legionellales bacterium RIFCSPHIGHO2_12_FULL_35_11]